MTFGNDPQLVNGAVLCGGRSGRFGSDKALAPVNGRPMGLYAVEALHGAGVDPVLAVASNEEHGTRLSDALGVPAIVDRWPGEGPLGGLITAMLWFRSGSVFTLPCDLPLVTSAALTPLIEAARRAPDTAAVAETERGPNCTIGVWPARLGSELKIRFDAGARRLDTVLEVAATTLVELPTEAVGDADTVAELRSMTGEDCGQG